MTGMFYDWASNVTDDPAGLPHGPPCPVYLNGKRMPNNVVTRCQTGSNGWVEVLVRDANGMIQLTPSRDEVRTTVLYGEVEVRTEQGDRR